MLLHLLHIDPPQLLLSHIYRTAQQHRVQLIYLAYPADTLLLAPELIWREILIRAHTIHFSRLYLGTPSNGNPHISF